MASESEMSLEKKSKNISTKFIQWRQGTHFLWLIRMEVHKGRVFQWYKKMWKICYFYCRRASTPLPCIMATRHWIWPSAARRCSLFHLTSGMNTAKAAKTEPPHCCWPRKTWLSKYVHQALRIVEGTDDGPGGSGSPCHSKWASALWSDLRKWSYDHRLESGYV